MDVLTTILLVSIGGIVATSFYAFGVISLREDARRASWLSFIFGTLTLLLMLFSIMLPLGVRWIILVLILAFTVLSLMIFTAYFGQQEQDRGDRQQRFDERDVVFARSRLVPGSQEYKAYYALRPENLARDKKFRALPGLLSPKAHEADPLLFPSAKASFEVTEALREAVDGPVASRKIYRTPEVFTTYIKGLALHLGAINVGITELQPGHVYSHIGRGTGIYGTPIDLTHRFAIAFTVEMDYRMMGRAPAAPVVLESARKYVEGAVIAIQLSNFARRLGYPARAHIDGNYRVIAPLVARDAGLGEIGRMGILMTPNLGPRVRLGVVTTDMPLIPDARSKDLGMIDFCRSCVKCAENCPSKAIPFGEREEIDGGLRWKLDENRCFHYWNAIGTDCGLCMTVCPYSHPDNLGHNFVRLMIRHSWIARRAALWLDDLFYGRKPAPRPAPDWIATTIDYSM